MIFDANHLPLAAPGSTIVPDTLRAEVLIIGGGAAGIALGLQLADSGRTVLLLEGGGLQRTPESQARYDGRYEGTFVTRPWPGYLGWSRVRQLGGSTNHWAGWCRPLSPIDFEARDWVPGSGWPFGREALVPHYDAACAWAQVPVFPELHGGALPGPELLEGDPNVEDALFFMSPPTRFGTVYRPRVADHSRLRLIHDANVMELATTPDGQHLDHVVFRAPNGAVHRASARATVLATGGVENARLLLNSDRVHRRGLGNAHDLVGRYFMDHPHLDMAQVVLTRQVARAMRYKRTPYPQLGGTTVLPVLSLRDDAQRREKLSGGSYQLLLRGDPPEAATVRSLNRLMGTDDGLVVATILGRIAQIPNPDSRVTLVNEVDDLGLRRVKLDWRLTDADRAGAARTLELLGLAFARKGLGRLHAEVRAARPWPKAAGGCHHMGTTRMHVSPTQGVVDENLKVHGVSNLYVAGSSVFPTGGYANPTLTILALALRLGAHLDGVLG